MNKSPNDKSMKKFEAEEASQFRLKDSFEEALEKEQKKLIEKL